MYNIDPTKLKFYFLIENIDSYSGSELQRYILPFFDIFIWL